MAVRLSRRRAIAIAIGAALALVAVPTASAAAGAAHRFGPYELEGLPDQGSCGNVWAIGIATVTYTVSSLQRDGSRWLVGDFRNGRLVTQAGRSPGACDADNADRSYPKRVVAGIVVRSHQLLSVPVIGAFDAAATCPASCTPDAFLVAFFGADAVPDLARIHVFARYHAPQADTFRTWVVHSGPQGSRGDICCAER